MSQQPAWRRVSTTARSPKASSSSSSFDADREKLLQFMNIGRDDNNSGGSLGNKAQMNSFRRHHHQNHRRRRRDEEGFVRRFVGRRLMRGTLMQKMVLFGPMLWFAVSLGALFRYKSTKESQSALTMGDDDDGAFVTTHLKTGGGEVEEEMTVHEKAPITFESDEKMQRDREREEAMIARGRHPCLNNGVYKVETDECVCHGGWKGENCDRAICEEVNCVNGRCVKPDVCECFPGFSKFDCSKDFIRDESGMLLDHLQVRLHATSIGLSKKDPAEAIELVQRWGISSSSRSHSGSNSKSENEVNGPWLAREDALGNRVLKSDQNLHNKLFFSCAVVGNSFHLEKVDGLAEVVDEHEAVIRLDAAPTTGRFASMVGTKTTVRVLSDAFLEDALKNPSKYAKLFTSTNGVSNSGNWETKGILWEPNSVSKLRQARRAFPELDVQFASPEILYPAKTIFNEVYNRLNAETKEHIEKALFGDTNGKDESSDKGGRGYSFFSSSSSKSSSSEVTNTSELKPTLSNAFFAVFLSLQMCVNVNVYGIDPPHEFLHDDDHDEKDSYFDSLSGGNGLGVSPASKIYESLLLRLFHDRRLVTRCDGFARAQKCVSFTPRGRKGLIARQAVHW